MSATIQQKHSIVDSTVFLRVSFGVPGNSRRVNNDDVLKFSMTETQDNQTNGDTRMLKVSKELLESPELAAIKKNDGITYNWLRKQCLPYTDMGVMLLPIGQDGYFVKHVNDRLEAYKDERNDLVAAFLDKYPARINEAREKLEPLGLFNIEDYLSVEEIKHKFFMQWRIFSFAVPETLKKIKLFDAETAKLQETFQIAQEQITLLMRESLYDLTKHLQDVLTPSEDGKQKRIFASAVTNIQDFLDTFSARNITNDMELAELVNKAKQLLDPSVSASSLKKDEAFKETVLGNVKALTNQLASLVENVPGRKFKDI